MTDNTFKTSPRFPRPIEELNLLDNFLFQEMLQRGRDSEEFCRILLGTILNRTIRRVRVVSQMPVLGADSHLHGIRMDAYIEELPPDNLPPGLSVSDIEVMPDIYDIEPNKSYEKSTLPKRMRYYHALIDSRMLSIGTDYGKLPNVVTIMILPYDPFDKNRMVYTIANRCIELPELPYDDGARKLFLYTKGNGGSQKLRDMLKYIEETTDSNVTNQDIASIHEIVNRVRKDKEVGINYMKSWEMEQLAREEGKQEGKQEGKLEFRTQILQLIAALKKDNRLDDLAKVTENPNYCEELLQEYGIS